MKLKVDNIKDILPKDLLQVDSLPEDPAGSITFMAQNEHAGIMLQVYMVGVEEAMDYDNVEHLIHSIHNTVREDQALVEVDNGLTASRRKFIYSIVKTKLEEGGVQYTVLIHIDNDDEALSILIFLSEMGITGQRDAAVFEWATRQGIVSINDRSKWMVDRYVPDLKRGYLMNLSEYEDFDEAFPEHPLSRGRKIIKIITESL